jgi:hypothetical protein
MTDTVSRILVVAFLLGAAACSDGAGPVDQDLTGRTYDLVTVNAQPIPVVVVVEQGVECVAGGVVYENAAFEQRHEGGSIAFVTESEFRYQATVSGRCRAADGTASPWTSGQADWQTTYEGSGGDVVFHHPWGGDLPPIMTGTATGRSLEIDAGYYTATYRQR